MSGRALNPEFRQPASPGLIPLNMPDGVPRKKVQSVADRGTANLERPAPSGWNWWQRVAARRMVRDGGRNVLIVGAGRLGRELAAILKREGGAGRTVVGFLDASALVAGDVLGRVEDLARIARAAVCG